MLSTLKDLRSRAGLTQAEVGSRMRVPQGRVSEIEQTDPDRLQVSTLRRYVEACGFRLDLDAVIGSLR